jgi:hypothetical protein
MFGLFSSKQNHECPIDPDMRLWMENAFLWLATQFGQDNIATKQTLLPTPEHFPIRYDGSIHSLIKTAEIVARQMEIESMMFPSIHMSKIFKSLPATMDIGSGRRLTQTVKENFQRVYILVKMMLVNMRFWSRKRI